MSNLPTKFLTGKADRMESCKVEMLKARFKSLRASPSLLPKHLDNACGIGGGAGSLGGFSLPRVTPSRIRSALVGVLRACSEPIKGELGLALHLPKSRRRTA